MSHGITHPQVHREVFNIRGLVITPGGNRVEFCSVTAKKQESVYLIIKKLCYCCLFFWTFPLNECCYKTLGWACSGSLAEGLDPITCCCYLSGGVSGSRPHGLLGKLEIAIMPVACRAG